MSVRFLISGFRVTEIILRIVIEVFQAFLVSLGVSMRMRRLGAMKLTEVSVIIVMKLVIIAKVKGSSTVFIT